MAIETDNELEERLEPEITKANQATGNPNKDYKLISDMLKEMKEEVITLQDSVESRLRNTYGLTSDVIEGILPYRKEYIENKAYPVTELRNMLHSYSVGEMEINVLKQTNENIKLFNPPVVASVPVPDAATIYTDEEVYEIAGVVKDMSMLVLTSHKDFNDVRKDSMKVLDEYVNYMSSSKITEIRRNRLNDLEKSLEAGEITNPYENKKAKHKVEAMRKSLDYSFIYERLEKVGQKEVDKIIEGFFNSKRGDYDLGKYKNKIKLFGYNPEVYRYFFNLEETFLPEEWAMFNNLFVYVYIRFVAFADPYKDNDKLYVQSITGALANLIYHRFNQDEKSEFIDVVIKVLKYFESYKDKFINENTTWEKHPDRIEHERHIEDQRRDALLHKLEDLKYPDVDAVAELSIDELQAAYDEYVSKLILSQAPEQEVSPEEEEAVESVEEELEGEKDKEHELSVLKDQVSDALERQSNRVIHTDLFKQ